MSAKTKNETFKDAHSHQQVQNPKNSSSSTVFYARF